MRFLLCFLLGMFAMSAMTGFVAAADFAMDVDKEQVGISVGFDGEVLTVFGTKPSKRDIVVIVEGPHRDAVVRKKSRVFGAWMNTDSVRFKDVPLFYDYALLAGDADADSYAYRNDVDVAADFKAAFIRNKQDLKHYGSAPRVIQTYDGTALFRVDFQLPSNVPVGEYKIALFEKGQDAAHITKYVMVSQAGGNARMKVWAQDYSFFYGLGCIVFALFAGWFSNRVRRRA